MFLHACVFARLHVVEIDMASKSHEPFRAVANSLWQISGCDPAALCLGRYVQEEEKDFPGWLGACLAAPKEKVPLPNAPSMLRKAEVVAALEVMREVLSVKSSSKVSRQPEECNT